MKVTVKCPICGKSMRLPPSDEGQKVACLSCGGSFSVPPAGASAYEPAPTEPLGALLDTSLLREPAKLTPTEVKPPPKRRVAWKIPTAVAGAILLVLVTAWAIINLTVRPPSTADQLLALRDEARELARGGKLEAAQYKYRELDRRAGEVDAKDTESRKIADEARAELEQVAARFQAEKEIESQLAARPATKASPASQAGPTTTATTAPTSAPTQRPPLHPLPEIATGVTDDRIGVAIQRGVDHMVGLFDPAKGRLRDVGGDEGYICGLNALCIYALLQSGQATPDKRLSINGSFMKPLLAELKRMPANSGRVTYARSIRVITLTLYNREEDRTAIADDVQYLLSAHSDGGYSYTGAQDPNNPRPGAFRGISAPFDNSNSQYGLLGVWSAAEAGHPIPADYWAAIQKHWNLHQLPDGMWGYNAGSAGTISMTAAGTASLFVAEDYLYASRFGTRVGREPFSPHLQRALDWWSNAAELSIPESQPGWWGYALYGIERVGLASGFKYFGKRNWYGELAEQVVARQLPNGSWGNPIDSAFALLFLSRGRHPILMNKLRFDKGGEKGEEIGFWANRPRDAANLARYAGRQLERPLNWQIVSIDREWHDWMDSPILSIASHEPPYFTEADRDKLRHYAEAGGMLFLQADDGSAKFDAFARRLAAELFPRYPLQDLPADHALYNVLYKFDGGPPPLKAVNNGSRLLMVYSPRDITRHWQVRDEKQNEASFQLGVNMFVYAAGKRELRNRLSSPYVSPPPVQPPLGTIEVARLKYDGNWDPEPGAWRRFGNWFARQTGTGVSVDSIDLKSLTPGAARVACLTGTAAYKPTDEEIKALRECVEAGGVVFIDMCGGSPDFARSMKTSLNQAFPGVQFEAVPAEHPLLNAGPAGMDDLTKPRVRRFVAEREGAAKPELQFLRAGDGAVFLSEMDVTSGLLGTETWGIYGYEPSYALALMKNLIFWTVDGKNDR